VKRSNLVAASSIATLVLAAAVGGSALAGPTSAAASADLSWTATITSYSPVDNAPSGESAGDAAVDRFVLRQGGHRAGLGVTTCVLADANRAHPLAQCSGTLAVDHGTLVLSGLTTGSRTTTYAVVGGTGRWAGAGGEVHFTPHGRTIDVRADLEAAR
jgi:hypothetical protein